MSPAPSSPAPEARAAVQPPAQAAEVARHHGPGGGQTQTGDGRRCVRAIDPGGAKIGRAGPIDAEGLDPTRRLAIEGQAPVGIARRGVAGGEAGGRDAQIDPRPAVATPGLQIWIGQVAGQGQTGRLAADAGQARVLGGSGEMQGDAIARRGQIDCGLQPPRLGGSALEGRRGHPGGQPHQLAVVNAGVTEDVGRAVVGVEPDAGALDQNQRAAAVGTRRTASEALDQRVQRAKVQFAVADAGAHHRADKTNPRGRQAYPSLGPGRADGVVDLDPFDDHVRIGGVADADAGHQAVQFEPLDLHVGLDALLLQPTDQDLPRRRAAVEVEQGRQDQQHADDRAHDQQGAATACAHGPRGGRSRIGSGGHGPVISGRTRGRKGR